MTSAISVKDRLKTQAMEDGKTMQDKLVTYGLERTIYRLSVSQYAERFTLKGGIFLYALFDGEYARATMDIDLLAQRIPNDAEEMKKVLYAYSIYSVIAEKFEAIVSLGLANGRYKDFYDIYVLADRYGLDGTELKNAIVETFTHRGTGFDDIAAFEDDFTEDATRQGRWNSFIKKKKALVKVEFAETMQLLKVLLLPIVDAIHKAEPFEKNWDRETKTWM